MSASCMTALVHKSKNIFFYFRVNSFLIGMQSFYPDNPKFYQYTVILNGFWFNA